MAMTKTVYELTEIGDKLMKTYKQKIVEQVVESVDSLDPELYELFVDMFRMYDLSMKLVKEQAETMDEINNKLDRLLVETKKGS